MSDNKRNQSAFSGKLGLSGDKISIKRDKEIPKSVDQSHKGKVVIITKNKERNNNGGLTQQEVKKRFDALSNKSFDRPMMPRKKEIFETANVKAAHAKQDDNELLIDSAEPQNMQYTPNASVPAIDSTSDSRVKYVKDRGSNPDAESHARYEKHTIDKPSALYHKKTSQIMSNIASTQHKMLEEERQSEKTKFKKKTEFKDYTENENKNAPAKKQQVLKQKKAPKKLSVNNIYSMADEEEYSDDGFVRVRRRKNKNYKKQGLSDSSTKEKIVREVLIPEYITVQELAGRMAEKAADIIRSLMNMGVPVTINHSIDADTAELIISEFGHIAKRVSDAELEASLIGRDTSKTEKRARPPVVTVMGHVDHGKTSLLDALRSTDVAAGEAGGITQHIGAYQVTLVDGRQITFLDTPGHEAFTAMRARGAQITDIVVLVVAADDGIMNQTIEAINHAKLANVPIIIAINKMDKHGADPDKVRVDLLTHGVICEAMGGDTVAVEVSAKTKLGLSELEDMILLTAEMLDLKSQVEGMAGGSVIEAKMEKGVGSVATLLVQSGTLSSGDIIVAGTAYGKIRTMFNDKKQVIQKALPSMPVEVMGLDCTPTAGTSFLVVENDKKARDIIALRLNIERNKKNAKSSRSNMENMFVHSDNGDYKELHVVLKTDVQGSVEAIIGSLSKLGNAEVKVKVIHYGVGGVTESDVALASTGNAIVVGFNVRANVQAKDMAKQNGVEIRYYSIIYDIIDDMNSIMSGMLSPMIREEYLGTAEVKQVFNITKVGKVAGCMVLDGVIKRNSNVRIIRDNVVIHDGMLKTLKRNKDDVKEAKHGFECGVAFERYEDIKQGDKIECYELKHETRAL